jgi:hypothetical protein
MLYVNDYEQQQLSFAFHNSTIQLFSRAKICTRSISIRTPVLAELCENSLHSNEFDFARELWWVLSASFIAVSS